LRDFSKSVLYFRRHLFAATINLSSLVTTIPMNQASESFPGLDDSQSKSYFCQGTTLTHCCLAQKLASKKSGFLLFKHDGLNKTLLYVRSFTIPNGF
jgi:hypothetical protein